MRLLRKRKRARRARMRAALREHRLAIETKKVLVQVACTHEGQLALSEGPTLVRCNGCGSVLSRRTVQLASGPTGHVVIGYIRA